ncbi:MAG TPA: PHP domain-containing protein [Candidatus Paceibacterota bacterium]
MKSDLHLHSNYSDGSFSPTEVMQRCKDCGVEVVSLTDHENVGGITEAEEAGDKLGIRVIPGIELSSDFQGGEHHILGYFIDPNDQKLKEFLETWKASKIAQIKEIIGNLQKFGFEVSSEKVINSAKGSLDRYHIVKAIFPDHEKSAEAKEEQSRFFRKFLMEKFHGGEGLAFVEREKPDIQSVINVIHDVGGMAFWAHPFWKIRDESVIRGLAKIFDKVGIDGIEVLYPYHNKEQADLLHKIARDFSLYESAGSDFHRKDDSVRQIAGFQDFGIEINFPFYEGGNT